VCPQLCILNQIVHCQSYQVATTSVWTSASTQEHVVHQRQYKQQESCAITRWPRNAPYIWVPWKFLTLWLHLWILFPNCFDALLFQSTLWMSIENLKCVALVIPEIIRLQFWLGVVNPNLGEEEVVGGRRWYHSKEHWWLPTDPLTTQIVHLVKTWSNLDTLLFRLRWLMSTNMKKMNITNKLGWARIHQTHYRSYQGRVFMGQMTQPTVSKHWRKIGPKD